MGCGSSKQEAEDNKVPEQTNANGGAHAGANSTGSSSKPQVGSSSSVAAQPSGRADTMTKTKTASGQSKARMDARKNAGKKKPAAKKTQMKMKVDKAPVDEEEGLEAFMRDTANIDNDLNKFGATIAFQKRKENDEEDLRQEALAQQQYLQATYFNDQKPNPPRLRTPQAPEPEPEPEVQVEKFLPSAQLQFDNSKFRKGGSPVARSPVAETNQSKSAPAASPQGFKSASPARSGPTGFSMDEEPEPMMAEMDLEVFLDSDDENAMDNILNDM